MVANHVDWTFVYLMLFLKIPIALLFWIVWWAVHNVDEESAAHQEDGNDDDGGIRPVEHPRGPKPKPARRGPHPGPRPLAPARSRRTPPRVKRPTGRDHQP
jgi:hypothetical protein